MTEDRFQKVQQLFLEAQELSPERRLTWLREVCGTDNSLFDEVRALLAHSDRSADPLEEGINPRTVIPHETQDHSTNPRIPGYQILRRLAVGGQAVVYEGKQNSTGQIVAVKLLRMGVVFSPEEEERFLREVEALAKLQHPHIVPIIDRGKTETGIPFLVTQYINGWPVDKFVDEQLRVCQGEDVEHSQLLILFVKIAKAAHAAHQRGVIHRDLKPSNVLVDSDGEPRILDFGLAKAIDSKSEDGNKYEGLTISGAFIGSLPWASPEQAAGQHSLIDHRTDIYSLGVILYQMLTGGCFPYQVVGTMRDVLDNILNAAPTPPSKAESPPVSATKPDKHATEYRKAPIHPTLEAIVLKALAKPPEQRYQSAADLAKDIQDYIAGKAPVIPAARVAPSNSTRRISIPFVVGFLAALAVGAWYSINTFLSTSNRSGTNRPLVANKNAESDADLQDTAPDESAAREEFGITVDTKEEEVFQRLTALSEAQDYFKVASLYRYWTSLHPHGELDRSRCTGLLFHRAVALFGGGKHDYPEAKGAYAMYDALIDSNPNAVHEQSQSVAELVGNAHVVRSYYFGDPPSTSAVVLNDLFEAVGFIDRLIERYPHAAAKPEFGFKVWRAHTMLMLSQNLLAEGNVNTGIRYLMEAISELEKQDALPRLVLHFHQANIAILAFALPDEHGLYERAERLARSAESSAGEDDSGSYKRTGLAASQFGNKRYTNAAASLGEIIGPEDCPECWLYFAMTLARLNRIDEAQDWLANARDAVTKSDPARIDGRVARIVLATAQAVVNQAAKSRDTHPSPEQVMSEIIRDISTNAYHEAAQKYTKWRTEHRLLDNRTDDDLATIIDSEIRRIRDLPKSERPHKSRVLAKAIIQANRLAMPPCDTSLGKAIVRAQLFLCNDISIPPTAVQLSEMYQTVAYLEHLGLPSTESGKLFLHSVRGQARLSLAKAVESLGRFGEAIASYHQAIDDLLSSEREQLAIEAQYGAAWIELATRRKTRDDHYFAIQLAEKAYLAARTRGDILTAVAAGSYRAGNYEKAAEQLREAQQLQGGDHAGNWLFLALTLSKLGQHDEATSWLQRTRDVEYVVGRPDLQALSVEVESEMASRR